MFFICRDLAPLQQAGSDSVEGALESGYGPSHAYWPCQSVSPMRRFEAFQ
jgi:hypothetical protein